MQIRFFSGLITLALKTDFRMKLIITLTRIRPTRRVALDDDNLRGSLKACRDGIADALGTTDANPRLEWRYAQDTGPDYAVRIQIESTTVKTVHR
jgi:hypothetical protein